MAFKNVRNQLLINHNDGFIDDDEFVVLFTTSMHRKTSTFRTIHTHLLTWKSLMSLRVLQGFALENEICEFFPFSSFAFFSFLWASLLSSALFSCSRISSSKVSSSVGSGTSIPDAFSSYLCFSLCREIRSAYRSVTTLLVTLNSGLFREFK